MFRVKSACTFILLSFLLISCSEEYAVEDELYACIEQEFADHSLNLEEELDTLENLFLEEEVLKSAAPKDYLNYYQNNIDEGMLISPRNPYLIVTTQDVKLSFEKLERCALRKFDGETFDRSKFGKISNWIDSTVLETGQVSSSTVAKAHLKFLTADDFEHPFYRATVLLSLQLLYINKHVRGDGNYIRRIPQKL